MEMTSRKRGVFVSSLCLMCAILPCQAVSAENPFGNFLNALSQSIENKNAQNQAGEDNAAAATSPPATASVIDTVTLTKTANMRSGPGTSNPVLMSVPKGTVAELVSKQGSWYEVKVNTSGSHKTGWIHTSLIAVNTAGSAQPAVADSTTETPGTSIDYAGYSAEYRPIKEMLVSGNLDGIDKYYMEGASPATDNGADKSGQPKKEGFLRLLEHGTISIDRGDYPNAVDEFSEAEALLDERKQESKVGGFFKKALVATVETVSGNEELQNYRGEGWEKVLMLNYKSIALLLHGDRGAYNVTRRAIDWQNIEKKAFDQKMVEEKEKAKEDLNAQKKSDKDVQGEDAEKGIAAAFAPMDAKAARVPSAYVNPFGFYVAGMIQEFESYADRSLRDNARISYGKALELNPESKVLKDAVADMKKTQAPTGTKLVHVVVADGFVPEKKVLTNNVKAGNSVIPMKLPIYDPVPSQVYRIEVRTTSGKRLATLSPVADVEAICLRQQKDMQPILTMRAMSSFFVTALAESAAQNNTGIGGAILQGLSNARKNSSAPDTRSWMSLPATIQAARLHLGKGVNKLKIETYSKSGKRLASTTVNVKPGKHNFIYARSIDKVLYAQSSEKLWLAEM